VSQYVKALRKNVTATNVTAGDSGSQKETAAKQERPVKRISNGNVEVAQACVSAAIENRTTRKSKKNGRLINKAPDKQGI